MMMFAILFGLSMEYEVFLLSRIREEYERTGNNAVAVADGLASTARVIITAAALIMVSVLLRRLADPGVIKFTAGRIEHDDAQSCYRGPTSTRPRGPSPRRH
jgi:uncharacterized membrane protein YdfJ with MMPL/SSD domain